MFRTEIPFVPHPQQLPLAARVLTIGSCFSDVMGARLAGNKVRTLANPFGTVFNPVMACRLLRAAAGEDMDWQQHLVEARGRWQSYDLHASIGAESPVALLQRIQELVQQTGEFLRTADVVVLTLGTAFSYRLRETDELVSNCHKVPAERFEKELLTPEEIVAAVAETHALLRLRNPRLRFILTVSPVRHLKDTLPLNAVSKSTLRVACHYLSELLPDVSYFPAYELLLDDLRDYRFYAADMLHPSEVAEDYVWERFARTYFNADFGRFRKEWEAVRQALGHRPLHPAAPEHRQFLESTLARLQQLASQTDMQAEIRDLHQQITGLPPLPEPEPEPSFDENDDEDDANDEYLVEEEPELPAPELPSPVAALPAIETTPTPTTELPAESPEADPEGPGNPNKKKRRSRGGAKRTARKKAAQLAAAQEAATAEVFAEEVPAAAPEIADAPAAVEVTAAPVAAEAQAEPVSATPEPEPEPDAEAVPAPDNNPEPEEPASSDPAAEIVPAEDDLMPSETPTPTPTEVPADTSVTEEVSAPQEATKVRKGRTAGQILKDKTGRKSAKSSVKAPEQKTTVPKAARPTRRKATPAPDATPAPVPETKEPVAIPPTEPTEITLSAGPTDNISSAPELVAPAAPKRKPRPPRKKPAAPDQPANEA